MKKDNILERIPVRKSNITWQDAEVITLIIHRDSLFEKIMHKIFKRADEIKVELEEFGSFVWKNCDGKNNIFQISEKVRDHFGEKAEPLVPRLVQYMKILNNNSFITLKRSKE